MLTVIFGMVAAKNSTSSLQLQNKCQMFEPHIKNFKFKLSQMSKLLI